VGFEQMWRDLAPVGRSSATGGYHRQPWTGAEAELRAWFGQEAAARGLEVEQDPLGNLVAWWRPVGTDPAARPVLTGSHLDSVVEGGAYDGPLGVVSALAAVDLMRERGVVPARPLGIAVFVEEEGSRFGLACLGSRLATGALAWADVRERRDATGTALADALAAAGLGPADDRLPGAGLRWDWLDEVACFVELHVEQGRALVDLNAAVGVASGIWPHGRWRFEVTGRADHAGTTRMEDRQDPALTWAATVLAADEQARLAGQRATFGRVEVAPNATNAVPSQVRGWLDARADSEEALAALVEGIERRARERAAGDGTLVAVDPESVSARVAFDPVLAGRLAALADTLARLVG
jgi:N-carbamoyl-L-amino-acid hydrolase